MFVVMLRAIKKPSFTFPIAQYPSANLIVWDTIEALELNDIHVVSITSDGASSNRNFSAEKGDIPYKVENPYRPLQYIYFFCDAPHLLKTARNCLSNSFAHSRSRTLKVKCNICKVLNAQ